MEKRSLVRGRFALWVFSFAVVGAVMLGAASCANNDTDSITTAESDSERIPPSRECTNGRDEYARWLVPTSLEQLGEFSPLVVVGTVISQDVISGIITADDLTPPPTTVPSIPEGRLPPGVKWTPPESRKVVSPPVTLSYVESQVDVHEVLRGELAAKATIVVRTPGDGSTTNCKPEDLAPLEGQRYLLFLLRSPAAPFEQSEPANTYWVTGGSPSGRFFASTDGQLERDQGTPLSPQSGAAVEVASMTLAQVRDVVTRIG